MNPFKTLEEVVATLETLGANPLCNSAFNSHWTFEILAISVDREYDEDCEHYYVTNIQTTLKGFQEFINMLKWSCEGMDLQSISKRTPYDSSDKYDCVEIRLYDKLTVCAVIRREEEFTW